MLRLPAEWEKQSFIQLTFPHENTDWNENINEVSQCFVDIISKAAQFQDVLVVCSNIDKVKSLFVSTENIFFTTIASNDSWARDHGGITVLNDDEAIVHDYIFNGWGQKFEATLDNQITEKLFEKKVLTNCTHQKFNFVLEGGSIESDGRGTLLTTSECLLSKFRNPQFDKQQIEKTLKENFALHTVLWLNHGYLAGDDTDSHIDTLARFCTPDTIAYVGCNNPNDEHYTQLQHMKAELQNFRTIENKPFNLVELPMADACFDADGGRIPATYANFTIINKAVLLPIYGLPQDQEAISIMKDIFPEREIVPINCRILIEQHGSLHCVTMQYHEKVKLNKEILL